MKITKKVFLDLAIFMIGFGIIVGLLFPVFAYIIGVPLEHISNYVFIIGSILAGFTVGIVNIVLARVIVGKRLNILSERMHSINENIHKQVDFDKEECLDRCTITVDTEDVIGETSKAFNTLVKSFLSIIKSEEANKKFTEIFTNELDLERLSEKAIHHLLHYTKAKAGMILIDKGGYIEVSYSHLIKDPEKMVELEIINKAFSKNERTFFEFHKEIKIEAGFIEFSPRSILIEPVSYKNEVIALIMLASTNYFEEDILQNISNYTHGLSLGFNNAIIHDKLEQLSILDPLTKTYNRRFGMERLKEEFSRSVRTNTPIGVLMLDLDLFKKVNDTYGHIVGDKVLINFSDIVKENLRKEDTLIRYGGEEFLVVLPNATNEGLITAANKIRRLVEDSVIRYKNQEIKITVSIGGVSFPHEEIGSVEEIIKKADENLYLAKETGRNKVVCK